MATHKSQGHWCVAWTVCLLALAPMFVVAEEANPSADARVSYGQRYTLHAGWPPAHRDNAADILSSGKTLEEQFSLHVDEANTYQLVDWLRRRHLDAAILPSFAATLLEREGAITRLADVVDGRAKDVRCPLIRVSDPSGVDAEPVTVLRESLLALKNEAYGVSSESDRPKLDFELHLADHYATGGFILPMIFAGNLLGELRANAEVRQRFWKLYFDRVRFHFGQPTEAANGSRQVHFKAVAYGTEADEIEPGWTPYDPYQASQADVTCAKLTRTVPNDVLVVTNDYASLEDLEQIVQDALRLFTLEPPDNGAFLLPLDEKIHEGHEAEVMRFFSIGTDTRMPLNALYRNWYGERAFDFSLTELLKLFERDEDLSLVLPGGGVKSLYQAHLIDHLYGENLLRNRDSRKAIEAEEEPLMVSNVIGTSGGAMVGMFAALLDDRETQLQHLFRSTAAENNVFRALDFPRYATLIGMLIIFSVVFAFFRLSANSPFREQRTPLRSRVPVGVLAVVVILFLGTPLAMRYVRGVDTSSISTLEVALFMGIVFLTHLLLFSLKKLDKQRAPDVFGALTKGAYSEIGSSMLTVTALLCYLLAGLGYAYLRSFDAFHGHRNFLSVLILLGTTTALLAIVRRAMEPASLLSLVGALRFTHGAAIISLYISATYTLVYVLNRQSLLELSGQFWLIFVFVSTLLSIVIIYAGTRRRGRWQRAITFIGIRQSHLPFQFSMLGMMLLLLTSGYLLWWAVVAPSLYSSSSALSHFTQSAQQELRQARGLTANLVVTGVLLSRGEDDSPVNTGGVFFCFPTRGEDSCDAVQEEQWFRLDGIEANMLDPVFASGSPFPVFPAHRVRVPGIADLRLVDGAYAHNVPLTAASKLSPRGQVLIIRSEPLKPFMTNEAGLDLLSQFVRYSGRVFPYLFERAQLTDQQTAAKMFVASIAPLQESATEVFPSLTSFTTQAMDFLEQKATGDIGGNKRIGSVDSWGTPTFQPLEPTNQGGTE